MMTADVGAVRPQRESPIDYINVLQTFPAHAPHGASAVAEEFAPSTHSREPFGRSGAPVHALLVAFCPGA